MAIAREGRNAARCSRLFVLPIVPSALTARVMETAGILQSILDQVGATIVGDGFLEGMTLAVLTLNRVAMTPNEEVGCVFGPGDIGASKSR
jgi:hypothetical protein